MSKQKRSVIAKKNGNTLYFKRGDEVVGLVQGGASAWWIEESDQTGRIYCVEAQTRKFIRVAAESYKFVEERLYFYRAGAIVCTIYKPLREITWWVEKEEESS